MTLLLNGPRLPPLLPCLAHLAATTRIQHVKLLGLKIAVSLFLCQGLALVCWTINRVRDANRLCFPPFPTMVLSSPVLAMLSHCLPASTE